ncbi:unnamed protein product, partial [Mesorhabditis spiculigera]
MYNLCRLGLRPTISSIFVRCNNQLTRPTLQRFAAASQCRIIHTTPRISDDAQKKKNWSMIMSEDVKQKKKDKISTEKEEKVPEGMVAKVKYYLKRYWYIAIPCHMFCSTMYLAGLYGIVYSGVDVVSLLHTLHMPELLIEKVKNTPPQAGALVVALILYKVATPLRYMTTLGLIQLAFIVLRRMGKLRTAKEVEYKGRIGYEKAVRKYGRRAYRNRHLGVREIAKANSEQTAHTNAVNEAAKDILSKTKKN